MAASSALQLGRSAAAAHRWREACEQLIEARTKDAAGLSAPDLELLATSLFLRGRPEHAADALTSAHDSYLALGDTVGAARTAGTLAMQLLEATQLTRAASWGARGIRLAERLEDAESIGGLVAFVPAAFTASVVGDVADGMRRFDAIAEIAERTGDREMAAHAAFGRGKSLTIIGRTAEGFADLDRAMAAVMGGEVSPVTAGIIYRMVLDVAHEGFDLRRAQVWTSALARWCRDQPELLTYTGLLSAYQAQLSLLHGAWSEASTAVNLAQEHLRTGDFTAAYVANYQLAELQRLRGEFRASAEHYLRAGETGWDPQPGLALLRLAEGEVRVAQTMIRQSVARADAATRRRLLPALVNIEVAAGDAVAARVTTDELMSLARSAPTPMLVAVAHFAQAQTLLAEGDATGALASVGAAASAWSELDAPYEVARCRVLRGRALSALGEPAQAVAELHAARAVFQGLGARPALAEVAELTGERPTGILTAREAEVLRLVSTGLTNRAIASRLSLSEKTVARHLSNIFGKLGLSSRAAATAYAYEHGLL